MPDMHRIRKSCIGTAARPSRLSSRQPVGLRSRKKACLILAIPRRYFPAIDMPHKPELNQIMTGKGIKGDSAKKVVVDLKSVLMDGRAHFLSAFAN